MNIKFINAKILKTHNDHSFDVVTGELWVKGNEIIYIGDGSDVADVTAKEGPLAWGARD